MSGNSIIKRALSFDDVLIIPKYSDVSPEFADVCSCLTNQIKLNIPIISSPMDTVTESRMAIAMGLMGGLGVIHRNMSIDKQIEDLNAVSGFGVDTEKYPLATINQSGKLITAAAIGVLENGILRAKRLIEESGVNVIVIDTAHGDSKPVFDILRLIKKNYANVDVIVGNIVTRDAAIHLIEEGASSLRVGVGSGSICTTRIVTGVGFPQFSAIEEISLVSKKHSVSVIADGGIRFSGDVAKAIGVGADLVMLGSLLASSYEAPGDIVTIDDVDYKAYRGMGSIQAMEKGSSDRYSQPKGAKYVPQGVSGMVRLNGHIKDIIHQIIGGLKSSMGYVGANTITEFKQKVEFVEITNSGIKESHVHSLANFEKTSNY